MAPGFGESPGSPSLPSGRQTEEEDKLPDVEVTWLGHASHRIDSPNGKRIYVDPWLDNPKCPDNEKDPERCDVIALTHGHSDHVGSVVDISKKFTPEIVAIIELKEWVGEQGAEVGEMPGFNKGGTVEVEGIKFTLVNAFHSSGAPDGSYVGEAGGLVIEFENGTTLYVAGDTCVFGDMQLIGRIYKPDVAVLPIGGHFTMDPREASVALELLGTKRCIPYHYGTFPLLTGTPDELRQQAPGVEVIELQPGESTTV
jgi:L-ascorbate metabolism protein UlaG (beta-lactamase superfamily)